MKHYLKPVFVLITIVILSVTSAHAGNENKMVIALKTDHFELAETDITDLAVGEAQTIETDSGKIIDILRTADGAEVYIDGELLEIDFDDEGRHENHIISKHIEIMCDDEKECDEHVVIHADGYETEFEEFREIHEIHKIHVDGENQKVIVIKKGSEAED